jgi:hypothetical protein
MLSPTQAWSKMTRLLDDVVVNDLDDMIDNMIDKNPQLLRRLNFKNESVANKINERIRGGRISFADLF